MSKSTKQIEGIAKQGPAQRVRTKYEESAKAKKMQPYTSEAEKNQRKAEGKTQGRTGCKTDRINLAFTVENYKFIKRFSRCKGLNMTDFVNFIIEDYRTRNQKDFEEIEKFIDKTL